MKVTLLPPSLETWNLELGTWNLELYHLQSKRIKDLPFRIDVV